MPVEKLRERWERSLKWLPWFASRAHRFWVFDNSNSDAEQRAELLATGSGRKLTLFNPNSEFGLGGTGYQPVPSGHWPDGMTTTLHRRDAAKNSSGALPVPSGESPFGTGRWPVLPRRRCRFDFGVRVQW